MKIFKRKRVLSVLLALCMALALLPGTAMAAEAEENAAAPLMVAGDTTPPVVSGMTMDNPGRTVRPGDKLEFWVAVEDESGIDMESSDLVFTYFCGQPDCAAYPYSKLGHHVAVLGSGQYGGFYDEEAGLAHFELTITDEMGNGEYTLSDIEIWDIYDNVVDLFLISPGYPASDTTGGIDFTSFTFTIEGASEGAHPPVPPDHETSSPIITALSMEAPGRTVRPGDTVEFYVSVEDESRINMLLSTFAFSYYCDEQDVHSIAPDRWRLPAGSYDAEENLVKFRLRITDDMVSGTYTLSHITLEDTCGNVVTYRDRLSASLPDLRQVAGYESVRFTVSALPHDHEPPTVDFVIMEEPGKTVTVGDTLTFYVSAEDSSGIDIAHSMLHFGCTCHEGPYSAFPVSPDPFITVVGNNGLGASYNAQTKQATFGLQITDDMHSGIYKLRIVGILDICGNSARLFPDVEGDPDDPLHPGYPGNSDTIDFDSVCFEIVDSEEPAPDDPFFPVPDSPPIYFPPPESTGGSGITTPRPEETPEPETPEEPPQPGTPAVPETPPVPVPAYADVAPTAWYHEAASYVSARGLMTGTSATEFSPAANMTRAMVWTVLGRLDGADVSGSGEAWYDNARAWSMSTGVSDGSNPNGSVTREELVTMLWRYMGSPAASADLGRFGDSALVSGWASGAVQWAVSAGLLEGSGGNLNPNGTATRAEVAAILMRFCENVVK